MAVPLIVAGVAARAVAKKVATSAAKKAAKTTVKKGTKSTKGQGMSTGKAKVEAYKKSSSKKYETPVKGSGKPKYQNVIKEARVNTKQAERKDRLGGKKLTKSESQARTRNAPNLAKQIDREYKIKKGVRTAKQTTPKVPTKKK
jgi:hypothetical protein